MNNMVNDQKDHNILNDRITHFAHKPDGLLVEESNENID